MSRAPSREDVARIREAAGAVRPRVLVVDDDPQRAAMLVRVLSALGECEAVHTLDQALRRVGSGLWDAAAVDFDLGDDGTGFTVMQSLSLLSPRTVRVLYSSFFNRGLAVEAARTAHVAAALDARREDFAGELRGTLARLLGTGDAGLTPETAAGDPDAWCARGDVTFNMLKDLARAAHDDAVVFVYGEPGTGKHLAATTLQRERVRFGLPATDSRGAAANRPLRAIRVPPLRERRAELADLCARFLAATTGAGTVRLCAGALEALARRDWWGNVRELHSALARAFTHARGRSEIEVGDLPHDVVPPAPEMQRQKDEALVQLLLRYLASTGSVNAAARHAEVTPSNFRRLMSRHGILRADTAKEHE